MNDPRNHNPLRTPDVVPWGGAVGTRGTVGTLDALLASDTRIAAHRAIQPHITRQQALILDALAVYRSDGLSCQQLEGVTGLEHSSCSARCVELERSGRIYRDGTRRTRSGRSAAIWKVRG